MSKFKYRLVGRVIEKHEILMETGKTVTYRPCEHLERVERKKTNWYTWHDSFDEAKAALIEQYENRIELNEKRRIEIEKNSTWLKLRIEKTKNLKEI